MRGGAFFNGKEGRDDFRKTALRAVTSLALLERARAWEGDKDPLSQRGTGVSKYLLLSKGRRRDSKKAFFKL